MIRNPRRLLADRAYDAKSLRDELAARRIKAVIRQIRPASILIATTKQLIKAETSSSACFCRLKDFRRIATRYDKRADIFLSAILLAPQ